jgi:hypothetical protein
MASNRIIAKKALGSITVAAGKRIAISAATQTSHWTRPDWAAAGIQDALEKAVTKNEAVLPQGTAEVCAR